MLDGLSFKPMYNIVYIDEKWFYRTHKNHKYYLANDEDRPHREVKSKNFIEKVMFLAVVTSLDLMRMVIVFFMGN